MNPIEIDGVQIAVGDNGAGRPALMLHCTASSGNAWREVSRWLGPGVRSVAPDFYGCGASGRWRRMRPLCIDDHVRVIETVASSLDGPIDLIGHSFGGAVALRTALILQQQGQLRSLTLVEPSAFHLLRDGTAADKHLYDEVASLARDIEASVLANDADRGMGRFVDYWNGPGAWQKLDPETRAKLAWRVGLPVEDFAVLFADQTTLDEYGSIRVPTMIIGTTQSPLPSQRLCELLTVAIPGAENVTISAGHMAPHTHPALIGALIASHLEYATLQQRLVA